MGVDTRGFTTKKSLNQVLRALVSIGYEVDKDVLASMNPKDLGNFKMIPISRNSENRVLSFGVYDSSRNGLAEALPKSGRRLKSSKQFTQVSLGADEQAFTIIQKLIGALGGGYVQFLDTAPIPAIEVDEKGSLVDNKSRTQISPSVQILRNKIRALVYFNRNSFVDLPKGCRENVFKNNDLTEYKPVLMYKLTDNRVLYTVYVNKDNQLFIDSSSYFGDTKLFDLIESYAKKHGIYMTLKDISY